MMFKKSDSVNPNSPAPGSSKLYRDPGNNIRGAQSQTVGSYRQMGGKSGSVEQMNAAAQSTDRFSKPWKET
jgi:hypothetical protein